MHDVGVANGLNFPEKLPASMLRLSWSSQVEFELGSYATLPFRVWRICPSLLCTGTIAQDRSLQGAGTPQSDYRALDYSASGVSFQLYAIQKKANLTTKALAAWTTERT